MYKSEKIQPHARKVCVCVCVRERENYNEGVGSQTHQEKIHSKTGEV